jgi:hypothetical protein
MDAVVYRSGTPWAAPLEAAFAAGLARHGIRPEWRDKGDWRASDLAIVWGHRDTELHALQRAAGAHYLVMERGFVGDIHARRVWTSLGFDGLNGRAARPAGMPADRWELYFAGALKPWRPAPSPGRAGGDYALLAGQVRGDAALAGVDIDAWYAAAAASLAAAWRLPVRFRPHPMDAGQPAPAGTTVMDGDLAAALAGAAVLATWNSNSAVDAVLAGVPAIAADRGAMAWPVAARDWDHRATPDRGQWAADLGYAAWRRDEIADGAGWAALAPVLASL